MTRYETIVRVEGEEEILVIREHSLEALLEDLRVLERSTTKSITDGTVPETDKVVPYCALLDRTTMIKGTAIYTDER